MPAKRLLCALLIALVLTATGCAAAVKAGSEQQPERAPMLDKYLGLAYWTCAIGMPWSFVRTFENGRFLVWVEADGTLHYTKQFAELVAHENLHIRQMGRHTCSEWEALSRDPAFKAEQEREAECEAKRLVYRAEC